MLEGARERLIDRWRSVVWRRRYERFARENLVGPKLLAAFADEYPTAFFAEIGANDGRQSDQLRALVAGSKWRGIMVEPQPEPFARLAELYRGVGRIALENAAIAGHDGVTEMFVLEPAEPGEDQVQVGSNDLLGSLSLDALTTHGWVERDGVATLEVPCMTLESLFAKHAVDRLDLMLVDTEGYDGEIIAQLGPGGPLPRLLIYEHCLMTAAERGRCRELVAGLGYEAIEEMLDTWCLDTTPADGLTASWRELSGSPYEAVYLRE